MKSTMLLVAALTLLTGLFPGMASANGGPPPHDHMLVQGVEFGPGGITYRKCVDLASNRAIPLNAHHAALHQGTGGQALFTHAGHVVIPTSPYSHIDNCAHLARLFPQP